MSRADRPIDDGHPDGRRSTLSRPDPPGWGQIPTVVSAPLRCPPRVSGRRDREEPREHLDRSPPQDPIVLQAGTNPPAQDRGPFQGRGFVGPRHRPAIRVGRIARPTTLRAP
jgi:hypothetical protein